MIIVLQEAIPLLILHNLVPMKSQAKKLFDSQFQNSLYLRNVRKVFQAILKEAL